MGDKAIVLVMMITTGRVKLVVKGAGDAGFSDEQHIAVLSVYHICVAG